MTIADFFLALTISIVLLIPLYLSLNRDGSGANRFATIRVRTDEARHRRLEEPRDEALVTSPLDFLLWVALTIAFLVLVVRFAD